MNDMTDANKTVLANEKALSDYVDGLIRDKNSPYVTDANRAEIKANLLRDLSDTINKKMLTVLSDVKIDELNKLLDANAGDEAVSKFFENNIPNLEQLVTEVLIDFKKGYLSVAYEKEEAPLPAPISKAN